MGNILSVFIHPANIHDTKLGIIVALMATLFRKFLPMLIIEGLLFSMSKLY